jgi:hypothetical protein
MGQRYPGTNRVNIPLVAVGISVLSVNIYFYISDKIPHISISKLKIIHTYKKCIPSGASLIPVQEGSMHPKIVLKS